MQQRRALPEGESGTPARRPGCAGRGPHWRRPPHDSPRGRHTASSLTSPITAASTLCRTRGSVAACEALSRRYKRCPLPTLFHRVRRRSAPEGLMPAVGVLFCPPHRLALRPSRSLPGAHALGQSYQHVTRRDTNRAAEKTPDRWPKIRLVQRLARGAPRSSQMQNPKK